ncbi:hypothetical protein [Streptomyces sp. NPDC059881]
MSDWTWDYNPSQEYVTQGLPPGVMAEVERLHECVYVCNITWYG